jgi:nicotinate-nucleotide pyrophosphorylase (carboxylating)
LDPESLIAPPAKFLLESIVRRALDEDLRGGDITSEHFVPPGTRSTAVVVARQRGIVAGIPVARMVFEMVDRELEVTDLARDGAAVECGAELMRIEGRARSVLAAERVALNFLQRLSGIATLTRLYVEAVSGTGARVVDTRKTTPGLRALEKYAVRCGGGANHRSSLGDAVLVKDNHRVALEAAGVSLAAAVASARARLPHVTVIEVEVDTLEQLDEALAAGPDAVLLDNMKTAELQEAVRRADGRFTLEASGGIHLGTVRAVAETGVHLVSVGALTHSPAAFDAALDFRF